MYIKCNTPVQVVLTDQGIKTLVARGYDSPTLVGSRAWSGPLWQLMAIFGREASHELFNDGEIYLVLPEDAKRPEPDSKEGMANSLEQQDAGFNKCCHYLLGIIDKEPQTPEMRILCALLRELAAAHL